ncbi:flagellar hook protein FlgE [Vibrio sp. 1-Bac 57]
MSFNVALSGIAAAQTDLDTTSNNIANVNTVGFKESRAEFDSVYANSLFSNSATKVGDGTSVAAVAQQFHQGSLKFTDNPLDLAITGSGFFATASGIDDKDLSYTRAGTFKLNDENYIVDNSGNYLQAFPVNDDGTSSSVSLSTTGPIQLPETAGSPEATSSVKISLNLPAGDEALDPSKFNPKDPSTYNNATSVTIYDSLGEARTMNTYYVKPENASADGKSQWLAYMTIDGVPIDPKNASDTIGYKYDTAGATNADGEVIGDGKFDTKPIVDTDGNPVLDADNNPTYSSLTKSTEYSFTNDDGSVTAQHGIVLSFDSSGKYLTSSPEVLEFEELGQNGAGLLKQGTDGEQNIVLSFDDPTQYASSFGVTSLEQDGLTVGRLTGVEIGNDGLIKASYSNGTSDPIARVAMVRFRNEQGLAQTGSSWSASQSSGDPIAGEGGEGSFGLINSAALEQSNVDLTTELVDLISAQRNFQANSRSLEISNELQQTILQIR